MTDEEKSKVHRLCYDSKNGRTLSPNESTFLQEMHRKYPKEYKAIHKAAAEEAMQDFQFWRGKK